MNDSTPPEMRFMPIKAQQAAERNLTRRRGSNAVPAVANREVEGVDDPDGWPDGAPPRKWLVTGLIPHSDVTMITGNGGDGKSLIALQLITSAVTNTPWLGRTVRQCHSMMVHAEDDTDEMKRRLEGILTPQGLKYGDLTGMALVDRDGREDNLLYEAAPNDVQGTFTPFYHAIGELIRQRGAEVCVLDSLYDFFGGNENVRTHAKQFINGLRWLAKTYSCAILLVAHPSRAGMGQGGDGTAGNTAWHNAVRSRLYLHRKKSATGDPNEKGPLVLEHMKNNYGKAEDQIPIMWDQGRFVPLGDSDPGTADASNDLFRG